MQLIPEAKHWHRLWSVRFAILTAMIGAVPAAYMLLPADWLPVIPAWVKQWCSYAVVGSAMATAGARVVQQTLQQSKPPITVPSPQDPQA